MTKNKVELKPKENKSNSNVGVNITATNIFNKVIEQIQKQINEQIFEYKTKLEKECINEVANITKSFKAKLDEQRCLLQEKCDKEVDEMFNKKQNEHNQEWQLRLATINKEYEADTTKSISANSDDITQKKQNDFSQFKTAKEEHYNNLLKKLTEDLNKEQQTVISNYIAEQNNKLENIQQKIIKDLKKQLDTWNNLPQDVLQNADQKFFEQEAEVFLQGVTIDLGGNEALLN